MNAGPPADRPLDEATVAHLVADQFGIRDQPVTRYSEGWDNELFAVGGSWLFRFPKREDTVWRLEHEATLLPVVEGATDVPVPRFELMGVRGDRFPYPFVGYRRIEGIDADRAPEGARPALARALGEFLTSLHGVDPSRVPAHPDGTWPWPAIAQELVEDAGRIGSVLPPPIANEAEPFLQGLRPPPPFVTTPRFIHGDLLPHHVLVDDRGRLAGIIDFADAIVDDPVYDFVGLVRIGGYRFVEDVLTRYDLTLDEGFEERLRWGSCALHLRWLGQAVGYGGVERAQRDCVVAFGGTSGAGQGLRSS